MPFIDAAIEGLKLRMAIVSPSGCGKTFSGLRIATAMVDVLGGEIYVICAEKGRAKLYAPFFKFKVDDFSDVGRDYGPLKFVNKIHECEKKATVLLIDGISPAWAGSGGALELVDQAALKTKGNKYVSWRHVTPQHNALVDAMLGCECHLIVTMRMKDEYVLVDKGGKQVPEKVGLEVIQRSGIEYEFDIVAQMDREHNMWFTKTRCHVIDEKTYHKPGEDLAEVLLDWIGAYPAGIPTDRPTAEPETVKPTPAETTKIKTPPINQLEETELTIQYLVNRIPAGLETLGVPTDQIREATEAAILLIRDLYDGKELNDIPDAEAGNIRNFMRTEMVARLKPFMTEAA